MLYDKNDRADDDNDMTAQISEPTLLPHVLPIMHRYLF